MGSINLYKIDTTKYDSLILELQCKMQLETTLEKTIVLHENTIETFTLTLYLAKPNYKKDISWSWVLDEFNVSNVQITPSPKAVIIVKRENESVYAVTFGHAFFSVDKFCDRDFGFDFARRLDYKEIKTTTLTTPNSQRNKTVSTYVNYNELEFESGESFSKLKAKVDLPEDFPLYKPAIEIGSSIKFSTAESSLSQIINLIIHVATTIETKDETCKIPVFSRIKDEELLNRLDQNLRHKIGTDPAQLNISELDIIGATEIFNNNDGEFALVYKQKKKSISALTDEELKNFCQENSFNYAESVLDIGVVSYYNNSPVETSFIKDIIDYTDDSERCILSKGIWYKFNDDYLSYLKASIAEIDVIYNPLYDFNSDIHNSFISDKFEEEKENKIYYGLTPDAIMDKLSKKYYAERVFNLIREKENSFKLYDRESERIGDSTIEIMDLYKDEAMITVKIGNSSGKLCYAIDQSLSSLKLYKKGYFPNIPKISKAVLWFVLDRNTHIEDASGNPDLNQLDMLMLKNRLDHWKKEVRLQGFKPIVYINYRS